MAREKNPSHTTGLEKKNPSHTA